MNKFDHNAIYIGMTEQLLFSKNKYVRTDMSFLTIKVNSSCKVSNFFQIILYKLQKINYRTINNI